MGSKMKAMSLRNSRSEPIRNATINIRNLRLRTFIGFNPEEMKKMQDVVINIEIRYSLAPSALEDQVDGALDYKTITKQVIEHVEDGRFLLLEKLVADVLEICSQAPEIIFSRVTIDKPHALRFADSVSLSLEYEAGAVTRLNHLERVS